MPAAEQLRLAEILDKAGFAYLEVSGGGCFDAAVKRGVESPWERIRALKARVKTPLGLALRGRFLVGSRPVDADFSRRFVASAAANGIDVFRLHDPLNDVSNLREAAEAIVAADRDFEAGLVYSPGRTGEIETLIERARMLPELGAVRVLLHDPTGSLQPPTAEELVPRIAVLAARHDVPASVVAGIDHSLQAENAEDRLDEVLEELDRIRAETGWPPLAAPIGQVLASQALLNVLSASRYITLVDEVRSLVTGAFGKPPAPIDPALERVVQLTADPESEEDVTPALDEVRERSGDIAASEEELLLLGLFGEDAERLLRGIRSRGRRDSESRMDENRAQRVQEIVRIVQESGI